MKSRLAWCTNPGDDEGTFAHCKRVATWVRELAPALGLTASETVVVGEAALYHHLAPVAIEDEAQRRLRADLGIQFDCQTEPVPEAVRNLLRAFWGRTRIADSVEAKLVAALEICDDFDQSFEFEPFRDGSAKQDSNSAVDTMMSFLQLSSRADVNRVIDCLPVFPRAAREIVQRVTNPDVTIGDLVEVTSLDPVLAGLVVQAANSSFYSRRTPVAALKQAIAYIGLEAARRILLGASFRGLYAAPRVHAIWNHSLDVARSAEDLARRSTVPMDPAAAFLAGLVHDVGRLAFAIMPVQFLERFYRLTDGGCALVQAEMCLSGLSHAEVGAATLKRWKFPDEMVDAVRKHHRPETSPAALSSVLYLAEFVTGSHEDLPSCLRWKTACRQAGISAGVLSSLATDGRDTLESLRFAA